MSFATFSPIIFERLGGYFSTLAIEDVPEGFAANCQNVRFLPGSVKSRSAPPGFGLTAQYSKAGRTFNGFAQFIDNSLNSYLLTLDDQANLDQQSGIGVSAIAAAVGIAGSQLSSASLNNKKYLALFGTNVSPNGPVRLFDGVNLDPFSPCGPGGKDHNASTGTFTNGSPTVTNVMHIETWSVGDSIQSAAKRTAAGTVIAAINLAASTLTLSQNAIGTYANDTLHWGGFNAADASDAGNIATGVRGVAISFITRSGYITEPSAPVFWLAAGSKKVNLTNLPTGPKHVIGRQIYFTLAGGLDFYSLPQFTIWDNTTTSVEYDFAETDLPNGSIVNSLFNKYRLPDQAGVGAYNNRVISWGGRNQAVVTAQAAASAAFTNAGFDGGVRSDGVPCGWEKGTNFANGTVAIDLAGSFCGGALKITGDGTNAVNGELVHCEARQRILANTAYTISIRAKRDSSLLQGTITIKLTGTGVAPAAFTVPIGSLTASFQEFHGALIGAADMTGIPPVDLQLSVSLAGTPTNGGNAWIDHIQIYPTARPFDGSVLRVSNAFDGETFDGVNGFIYFGKDDGQRICAAAQLRWYLYIFKDYSMYTTFDDGSNPPSLWSVNRVDAAVGAANPNAVDLTESFIAIAAQASAYVFFGGKPIRLSREIQATWNRINWAAKDTIFTIADPYSSIIRFFVPLDSESGPSHVLLVDGTEGWGTDFEPGGRKWSIDVYPTALRAGRIVQIGSPPTPSTYLAGQKVYSELGSTDDGTAIDSFYETSLARSYGDRPFVGTQLFGGVSYTLAGGGTFLTYLLGLGTSVTDVGTVPPRPAIRLPDQSLQNPSPREVEEYSNLESGRCRVRFESNGIASDGTSGDWYQVKRLVLWAKSWARQLPQ